MATYNNLGLVVNQPVVDFVALFGYETSAHGFIAGNDAGSAHIIWYVGDPVGKFLKVPNGSMTIDSTNHHTYTKTGAFGSGTAGAWVVNA